MAEARKLADAELVALNQLINVAVAGKVATLRTEDYFRERAARVDRQETLRILSRAGKGNPPQKGDELPSAGNPEADKPGRSIARPRNRKQKENSKH